MDRIAFISGELFIYWSSIILTLAVAAACCMYLSLYVGRKDGSFFTGVVTLPLAMVLSLVFARFLHWYCRADSYDSLGAALTNYASGGYALLGVFAGCFLTAVILRVLGQSKSLPGMLDCMTLAGGVGISVGRLASFYNASSRGQIVAGLTKLPWVYPVTNAVSGQLEYRLATFLFQSVITGVIVVMLLLFYLFSRKRKNGDVCVLFLLCYGAAQVVLDSTRYDSLFFRSNGFVSIVQVMGAVAIGLSAIYLSLRMLWVRGLRWTDLIRWLSIAAFMGVAGYMEYHVQRHGDQALFAYSVMSVCIVAIITSVLLIYKEVLRGENE